jgi:hypothetical protein
MNDYIVYEVASYYAKDKDLNSLLNLSKVNKTCNYICRTDKIWKLYLQSKFNYNLTDEKNLYNKYCKGYGFITNDKAIINCLLNVYGNRFNISSYFLTCSIELQKYCTYYNGDYISYDIDVKLPLDKFLIFGDEFQCNDSFNYQLILDLNLYLDYIFDSRNVSAKILLISDRLYLVLKKITFEERDLIEGFSYRQL